jgi:hypothetical protein
MLTSGPAELCYFYINLNSEKEYGTYQTLISDGEDLICCNTKQPATMKLAQRRLTLQREQQRLGASQHAAGANGQHSSRTT